MKRKETRRAWLMALALAVPVGELSVTAQTQNIPQVIIIPDPAEQSGIRFQRITPGVVVLGPTAVVTVTNGGGFTNTNVTPSVTNAVSPLTNGVGAITNSLVPPMTSLFPPATNVVVPLTNTLLPPATNLTPPATNLVPPLAPGLFGPPPSASPPFLQQRRRPVRGISAPTFLPPLSSPSSNTTAVPPLRSPDSTGSSAVRRLPPAGGR
jgi:hypothetical protein